MSRIDEQIENYRSRLHRDDLDDFVSLYQEAYKELNEEEIRDELETKFTREESHLELVMATASAFHPNPIADGYESGYRFAFTEPLEEQNSEVVGEEGVKNGDVLLAKQDGDSVYICIVECKAGNSAGRDWIQKLDRIREIVNTDRFRETLKDQLDAEEIRHEQYVILGKVSQVISIDYSRLKDGLDIPDNYAFCGYDLGDQQISKVYGNIQEPELASVVNDTIDAGKVTNPIELTFGDHPLIKLRVLCERIITSNRQEEDTHPLEFNRSKFYRIFDEELQVGFTGDIREELVSEEVDSLVATAKEINLFTSEPERINTERDYRILFQGKTVKAAKDAAEEKYLSHKSSVKRKERAFKQVREDFQPQQTRLDEGWGDDDEGASS